MARERKFGWPFARHLVVSRSPGRRVAPLRRRLAFEPLESRRLLATVAVANTFDAVDGDTSSIEHLITSPGADGISLREAILAANATAGEDRITFDTNLSGRTITLSGTELVVSESLKIDAVTLAQNVTVSGNWASRIIHIAAAGAGDFTFSGITFTGGLTQENGAGGGAIRVDSESAALTLVRCVVSNSVTTGKNAHGGGIFSGGSLSLFDTSVSTNRTIGDDADGGGIWTAGNATLISSTISTNSTTGAGSQGGGMWVGGGITLVQSTISGNSTSGVSADGGGIYVAGGHFGYAARAIRSTITDNRALDTSTGGGGVFQRHAPENFASLIKDTIVTGNSAAGGNDFVKDPDAVLTVNFSLIGGQISPDAGVGNIVSDVPQLGPLGDLGGRTQTHAPLAGSPAIDAGDPTVVPSATDFDQRGAPFARMFDGDGIGGPRIDMGAVEAQTLDPALFVVTTAADEYNFSNAATSLREAINLANGSVGADTIKFAEGLSGATIALGNAQLVIGEAVTIDARALLANVTIDAHDASRVFNITATTGDILLAGLNLSGGKTSVDHAPGGAIRSLSSGNLTLDGCTISGNGTTGYFSGGGGVFAAGNVTLSRSTVSGNRTTNFSSHGGGIYAYGEVMINESTIAENQALNETAGSTEPVGGDQSFGGGVFSRENLSITASTLRANDSTAGGGGVYAAGDVMLAECEVVDNHTTGNNAPGGGILSSGSVTVIDSRVSENSTTGLTSSGGGIAAGVFSSTGGGVTLRQSIVSGNTSTGPGGGIYARGAVALTRSTVDDNHTSGDDAPGGGILVKVLVPISLTNSTVSRNTTSGANSDGGGIASVAFGQVDLLQSTLSGNRTLSPDSSGGGIYLRGEISFFQSTVTENHAGSMGGGAFQFNQFGSSRFSITNSIFAGNTAAGGGSDLIEDAGNMFPVVFSLIGAQIVPASASQNVVSDDPKLAPLEDYGGPTETQVPLAGSPAIDAGNPRVPVITTQFDQRGGPFIRVFDGDTDGVPRVDIGAAEYYPANTVSILFGDYNLNGRVDAGDYTVWRTNAGVIGLAPFALADGSGNGAIDREDYQVWVEHFGQMVPQVPADNGTSPLTILRNADDTLFDFAQFGASFRSCRFGVSGLNNLSKHRTDRWMARPAGSRTCDNP